MARKPRTPPPPRRPVQAPQRRHEPRDDDARRRLLMWIALASVVLFAIAAILTFVVLRTDAGEEDGGGAPGAIADAGCELQEFPAQPAQHVEELEEDFKYNSEPPSSGPHSGQQPIFGIYTDPVDPLFYVHGLEHGGVVIQYGDDVPETEVDALSAWYRENPNGLIVGPRPELPDTTIALASWNATTPTDTGTGIVAKCPRFDEDAFEAFVDTYGFKGPESDQGDGVGFTRDDLTPGV